MLNNFGSFYKQYKCDVVLATLVVLLVLYVLFPKMIEHFEAHNDGDTKHFMSVAPNSSASKVHEGKPSTMGLYRIPNSTPTISNRPGPSARTMTN